MTLPTVHPIPDSTLTIIAVTNPTDPHLLVERKDGGLVRVEAREARRLACALLLAHREVTPETEPVRDQTKIHPARNP